MKEDSEVTVEARLLNDPEIDVRTKLVSYWGQELLCWHVGIICGPYWFSKTGGLRSDHGGQVHKWSWNRGQDIITSESSCFSTSIRTPKDPHMPVWCGRSQCHWWGIWNIGVCHTHTQYQLGHYQRISCENWIWMSGSQDALISISIV